MVQPSSRWRASSSCQCRATPHRDKKQGHHPDHRVDSILEVPGGADSHDHNNEETLPLVLNTALGRHSIYPNTKWRAPHGGVVKKYGTAG